jgi:hypothetical protein
VANSQDASPSQHPDLLAAVVLHTLLGGAREGMSAVAVALACERDPGKPDDLDEIEAALRLLLDDGLAEREGEPQPLYRATRVAIRANELSF